MDLTTHAPIGATIHDVAVHKVDASQVQAIKLALANHGMLHFPEQDLDDAGFVEFLRKLGPLTFTKGETPVPGHPDLNVVSNVGRTTPPKSNFHVDTSYVSRPPAYTALRTITLPEQGGQTLFTNQYRAYETLPNELRARLQGRSAKHIATGVELGPNDEASAMHYVFRSHPLTGKIGIYLSTRGRCKSISGLEDEEAQDLIDQVLTHCTASQNTYRHHWSPGDVVIWDNGCVLHRADHSGVVGNRVLHRGMSLGYAA